MDSTDDIRQDGPTKGVTTPQRPTHEATQPPGNGDRDEDAIRKSEEKLGEAGGGH
jgi:hypothetical protein